jgi:hypothetical protein
LNSITCARGSLRISTTKRHAALSGSSIAMNAARLRQPPKLVHELSIGRLARRECREVMIPLGFGELVRTRFATRLGQATTRTMCW